MSEEQPAPPLLRIVSPHATPEEIAALVAVLSSLSGPAAPPRPPGPGWASPARAVRRSLRHGAGAWRSSGPPH